MRRHVQAYMVSYHVLVQESSSCQNEAAADASTPSSKHLTIPVPIPPTTTLTIPQGLPSTAPLASPIPLSASTMLPFSEPPTSKTEIKNEFEFNTLPTLPGNNGLDLGNMNMSDFAAMMANNGFDYSTPQQASQNPPMPISRSSVNREQSDTDRLLAQLGAFTGPDTTQNQQQPITTVNNDEVDALLASLNDGNVGGGDYSNFDFGDIDLGSLGDMSGLFNTSTLPVSDGQAQSGGQQAVQVPPNTNTNMPQSNTMPSNTIPSTNTMVPNTQPRLSSQPQSQPQSQQQTQPQQQNQPQQQTQSQQQIQLPQQVQPQQQPQPQQQQPAPIKQEPPTTTAVPITDPNLDMSHVFDDSQAIDLDDFNFGDGDGEEGGIDLTGDEFENLLAAFN